MATGLTDMEELLERISAGQLREFMREALICYGAGAHRACIVLSFIAVFEDLRQKVKTAAGLNSDAKTISKEIEKLAAGQKPFETDLVNRLAAKNLLSVLQAKRLHQMIDFRNKAAHPSGHYASAEEARFVFFESIDSYLSKPLLSSEDFARSVLERLRGANYFPDGMMSNIENAVADEIDHLNPAAFPFLVSSLVSGVTDSDVDYARNCRLFLTGLAAKKDAVIRSLLAKHLIKAKAIDDNFREVIASNISADASVLHGAEAITLVRVSKLLVRLTKETKSSVPVTRLKHPLRVLRSMARDLKDEDILPDFGDFVQEVASTYWSNVELIRATNSEVTRNVILAEYMTRAGSNDFGTANRFAKALPDLDARLSEVLTPLEALSLLSEIWKAGETGAWDSNAMRKSKFVTVPRLKAAALMEIGTGSKKATTVIGKLGLTKKEFKEKWLTDEE